MPGTGGKGGGWINVSEYSDALRKKTKDDELETKKKKKKKKTHTKTQTKKKRPWSASKKLFSHRHRGWNPARRLATKR